jgi:hypothetical protein
MGEAKRRLAPPLARWTPFERGAMPRYSETEIAAKAAAFGVSIDELRRSVNYEGRELQAIWLNARYQVNVYAVPAGGWPAMWWLSIKRRDKAPIGAERFRDFQRIKNELVGSEHEAVEIYPAETRLVDTSNQYHLYVFQDPHVRLPFGFTNRRIDTESAGGAVQQPFEEDA